MNDMLAKSKMYDWSSWQMIDFLKQFCDGTTAEKQKAVKEANQEIETLKADIFEYATDAQTLGEEIAAHDEDISVWGGDKKAADGVRAIEKADYDAMHKDLSESVDALERAIGVLKKIAGDIKQAASL